MNSCKRMMGLHCKNPQADCGCWACFLLQCSVVGCTAYVLCSMLRFQFAEMLVGGVQEGVDHVIDRVQQ